MALAIESTYAKLWAELTSKDATLANVRAELKKLVKGRKRADLVMIGLAGHGLQFNDREKKEENGNYFCPTDAEPKDLTGAYAFSAVPVRYALERGRFDEAAKLELHPASYPWKSFPFAEAAKFTWFKMITLA